VVIRTEGGRENQEGGDRGKSSTGYADEKGEKRHLREFAGHQPFLSEVSESWCSYSNSLPRERTLIEETTLVLEVDIKGKLVPVNSGGA